MSEQPKSLFQEWFSPSYWSALRTLHYRHIRPIPHQIAYFVARLRRRLIETSEQKTFSLASIQNVLPNSGPIPYTSSDSAADVISQMGSRAGSDRAQNIAGFEGFAPDDAIYDQDSEAWRIWSYASLATAVAECAFSTSIQPKVLELGCGSGHVGRFLMGLGIVDYVGIDGHPAFIELNPSCAQHREHFLALNLQDEICLEIESARVIFDVICSFEVLEHIREDRVNNLLLSVRNHMRPGSLALLTASQVPQELCDVHVLVRDRQWWICRFRQIGLVPHQDSDRIATCLARCHPHNWSSKNSLIFVLTRASVEQDDSESSVR